MLTVSVLSGALHTSFSATCTELTRTELASSPSTRTISASHMTLPSALGVWHVGSAALRARLRVSWASQVMPAPVIAHFAGDDSV